MSVNKVTVKQNEYGNELAKPFYSIKQLADLFQVNRSTISRLLKDGALPYFLVRESKRIARQDVASFIDNQIAKNGSQKSSNKENSTCLQS